MCIKNLLLSFFILSSSTVYAERFSYVYIQGDKQIPFYVKLEDEMLPRYSKNYCIVPQLAPGPIRLQILFQQNAYPAQTFNIQVPADGYRGFLLVKNTDGFALFDIRQHFYLLPGAEGEDHLPEVSSTQQVIPIAENTTRIPKTQPASLPSAPSKNTRKNFQTDPPPVVENNEPQFMSDIELNKERKPVQNIPEKDLEQEVMVRERPVYTEETIPQEDVAVNEYIEQPQQPGISAELSTEPEPLNIANEFSVEETGMHNIEQEMKEPVPALTENAPVIINSDCPTALSDSKFDDIFIGARGKSDDDKRIGYLMKKASENCFTTRQAFLLSRQLQAESMRYSFLKKVYPRVTDQQNFHLLGDALFKTMEWKSYFKLIYE